MKGGSFVVATGNKLNHVVFTSIRKILFQQHISGSRITIDFDRETIETNDEPSVNAHVLQSAGILSKERAMEISKSVQKEREEQW